MENRATKIAEYLLRIKAVKLSPEKPYTWSSGWKSPIYCDNRLSLSVPELRNLIRDSFCSFIEERFPNCGGIAAVATAGIAHGALVADRLGLPFCYVRSSAKGHGLQNLIEGRLLKNVSYVVIEDLVSTGGSSLKAVQALREAGADVAGLASIFDYGFPQSATAFKAENISYRTLTNLDALLEKAVEINYIQAAERAAISEWRKDPENWIPSPVV